ncbi:MAG TPA: hypothetical protein V6C76_00805 [Drouetiella sp.]
MNRNSINEEAVQEQNRKDRAPLASAQYLGFYIPGQRVVLNRVATSSGSPNVVACEVAHLFEHEERHPR